jgi:hypothetical protein
MRSGATAPTWSVCLRDDGQARSARPARSSIAPIAPPSRILEPTHAVNEPSDILRSDLQAVLAVEDLARGQVEGAHFPGQGVERAQGLGVVGIPVLL